ncbi:MAG: nucleotidyltransferase [Oscillospiraceae bacterium]|nr:nucleotidyltransferase [Oscillospiraceae bacterium]
MKTSLIIMAAGLGSRFAGGIKQLFPVGPCGEIIMDYSIHDAIASGFDKIIIVLRKDIESDFREVIGKRIEQVCSRKGVELKYVFQEQNNVPGEVPEGRKKPWGTGQAVLAAKSEINEPFAVINADDFYGRATFEKLHNYLCTEVSAGKYCMAGFELGNTLSENGGVTRGICNIDEENNLLSISETTNVTLVGSEIRAGETIVNSNSVVSMNIWGFAEDFIERLEEGFAEFFRKDVPKNPIKAEFLIPVFIAKLLSEKKISIKVLPTDEKWFGTTYKEDVPIISKNITELIDKGVYKNDLYSDL